jgi:hypothetical protein
MSAVYGQWIEQVVSAIMIKVQEQAALLIKWWDELHSMQGEEVQVTLGNICSLKPASPDGFPPSVSHDALVQLASYVEANGFQWTSLLLPPPLVKLPTPANQT